MGHASKDATNPHFKSKYADFAAVVDAIRKPLTDNGLSFVQLVGGAKGSVTVTTRLLHASGQSISSTLTMPVGAETPQAYGSAITYGRRYSLSAMVGLASEEDDDGNAASVAPPATTVNGAAALKARLASAPVPAVAPKPVAPPAPPASPPRARVQIQDVREPGEDAPVVRRHENLKIRWGGCKDKFLSEINDKDLTYYAGAAQKAVEDPEKAKYREANVRELNAYVSEQSFRAAHGF